MLSVCTLDTLSANQKLDTIWEETEKRYMHHYNFPGYSVGEAKPARSPGRREIGHGALFFLTAYIPRFSATALSLSARCCRSSRLSTSSRMPSAS